MRGETPRIVHRRTAYEGWNRLDVLTVEGRAGDGSFRRLEREIVDHGHACVVLVLDRARGVAILVRQWRAPLIADGADPFLLEACAGIIDAGEKPEEAARREAGEEIGFTIGRMRKVAEVLPSAGTLTERMHLFLAEVTADQRTDQGGGHPQEGEDIEVVEIPLGELFRRARDGEIADAKTLILIQQLMIEDLEERLRLPVGR